MYYLRQTGISRNVWIKKSGETVLDFYFQVRSFLNIYDGLDENYVIYTEYQENGRFVLKLFCVNPAANLQKCLDKGNSAVFFSATLLPIQYYKRLLSTEKDNYAVYIDSSFDTKKRLLYEWCGCEYPLRHAFQGNVSTICDIHFPGSETKKKWGII